MMKRANSLFWFILIGIFLTTVLAVAAFFAVSGRPQSTLTPPAPAAVQPSPEVALSSAAFGTSVEYAAPDVTINPAISKDFEISEIKNIKDIEKAYGFTFTSQERARLAAHKFVVKNLLDTSIRPDSTGDAIKEFIQLYHLTGGSYDYKTRTQANAQFYTADVFFEAYNNLHVELLKELENKHFFPAMRDLSKSFYESAGAHLAQASSLGDKKTWTKVRDYFAVPYAIFSKAAKPLSQDDYYKNGQMQDPAKVQADFASEDAKVDTYDSVASFIQDLHLDAESQTAVLADLKNIYDASGNSAPAIFADEYAAYRDQTDIDFTVDFTQFTPRGTYTSSSLRRQYFRAMKWYIMVPFFLKSPDLTTYSFAITQLMAEQPDALKDYGKLESAIGFLVGESDDLMPRDYLQALAAGKGAADPAQAALEFLAKAHPPKIKDLAAGYAAVGTESTDDVRLKTTGMRFFSGKFIIDSYWTGFLTQGDEAPRPGYTQKLPPMASALQVMALLGSDYAKSQIPKLDFYKPNTSKAIDQAMAELQEETDALTGADWQQNLYTAWLWTIKSLFGWQKANHDLLPRFMQSPLWDIKTLQTAAAFWTELRHATILYAKQSFAELGGGPGGCDERDIPPPPKGYIEPQAEAFARLSYLAKRTDQGLKDQGYELNNLSKLESFVTLLDTVQGYVAKELGDQTLQEHTSSKTGPDDQDPTKTCTRYFIDGTSDWETLRFAIVRGLNDSLPVPTEGPIMSAKDRRTAIIADVHTGGDSSYPRHILYEGVGVPYVIFAAVKDANGARLTVGFTSSHTEFTEPYGGQRLTDEDWQKNFYEGDEPYDAFKYTDKKNWPEINFWYKPLFGLK